MPKPIRYTCFIHNPASRPRRDPKAKYGSIDECLGAIREATGNEFEMADVFENGRKIRTVTPQDCEYELVDSDIALLKLIGSGEFVMQYGLHPHKNGPCLLNGERLSPFECEGIKVFDFAGLSRWGFVTYREDPRDGDDAIYELTDKGRKAIAEVQS